MEELFKHLEQQIKTLIIKHQQSTQSNQELHLHTSQLQQEKKLLLAKQEKAISQIETLVSKLKSLEKLP